MLLAASIIWPIVALCTLALWTGPRSRRRQALALARGNGVFMALRMPFAMGGASGWKGILIASAVGCFVPSGPIVSFPFALALYNTGVGVPQLVAFLTSWSLLSVHTFMAWEMPVLGVRFPLVRYACSLILPPIAGFLAMAMVDI